MKKISLTCNYSEYYSGKDENIVDCQDPMFPVHDDSQKITVILIFLLTS